MAKKSEEKGDVGMAEEQKETKKKITDLEDLPGVGEVTAEKLRKAGYDIEKIAASSPHATLRAPSIGPMPQAMDAESSPPRCLRAWRASCVPN